MSENDPQQPARAGEAGIRQAVQARLYPHDPAQRQRLLARHAGCLLGGAVGDALGAPVEFMSLQEIRQRFGPGGIRRYAPAWGRLGAISDDTQMTLFTAEGLLRAWVRRQMRGIGPVFGSVTDHAYARWMRTQGERAGFDDSADSSGEGWLIGLRISAIVDARFRLIVDGKSAAVRGALGKRARCRLDGTQSSTISVKWPSAERLSKQLAGAA